MLRAIIRSFSLLLLCALSPLSAFGQSTVVNPRVVEFDPSADHSALDPDGQSVVARYDLQVFLQGASQPITTTSLGKPAIDTDGKIRVDFSTMLIGWPLANGTYEARVAAVGPTGSGVSDLSNVFDFQAVVTPPACTYALSATSLAAGASGASGSVTLTASATTCGWTAASDGSWVTVTPASGSGSGTVSLTVAVNTGVARTATVTIGGQTYTVNQAAAPPPCSYSLSAASLAAAASGASGSVTLTASATTCGWTASIDGAWVSVAPASGSGSATVSVTVAANTGAARTATVTIGGQQYTVTQAAAPPPCTFMLSPTSVSAAGTAGTLTAALTASAETCAWTATRSANWITLGAASGMGSASISYSVSRNNSGESRTGTITVGGAVLTVAQNSLPRPTPPKGLKVISIVSK